MDEEKQKEPRRSKDLANYLSGRFGQFTALMYGVAVIKAGIEETFLHLFAGAGLYTLSSYLVDRGKGWFDKSKGTASQENSDRLEGRV